MRRRKSSKPQWREFEEAVARFASAIAPTAIVRHDVRLPDVDTRRPRQRDVWIEATVGDFFPVRILVSCKRLRRRIDEKDVDAFIGEMRSAGAHKGVLFAKSGFTTPALEKAAVLGISCCRLFESEPAELPRSLLMQVFYCMPTVSIRWVTYPPPEWKLLTFGDFLSIELEENGRKLTVADCMAESAKRFHDEAKAAMTSRQALPRDVSRTLGVKDDEKGFREWRLDVALRWRVFRSKLEATFLNGAYSFTSEKFLGEQIAPWLDTQNDHPGNGWEELADRPDTSGTSGITVYRNLLDAPALAKRFHEQLGGLTLDEIPRLPAV